LSKRTCEELEKSTNTIDWQIKLHRLVNQLETMAFKEGFYLAAGLTGGDCSLCTECVTPQRGELCRHPFEARPSMEAMGIDVLKTCDNVGLPVSLSSGNKVRWTGLVLLY
jgi:predicted metal-binding protein